MQLSGRARVLVVTGVCVGVLALGIAPASAKTVSASKYVTAVCVAQTKANASLQSKFNALNTVFAGADPAATKTALINVIAAAPPALKTMLSSLKKAGEPKVTNGKQIARANLATLQSTLSVLPSVQTQLAALPTTTTAALKAAAQGIIGPLQTATQTGNDKAKALDKDGTVMTPINNMCGEVGNIGGGSGSGSGNNSSNGGQPSGTGGSSGGGAPASSSGGSSGGGTSPTAAAPK